MKKFVYRGHLFLQGGLSLWKMSARQRNPATVLGISTGTASADIPRSPIYIPSQSYKRCTATTSPANTMDTMDVSLIRMLMDGPEVSLKGSPTVSPMTAALCCGLPFPP